VNRGRYATNCVKWPIQSDEAQVAVVSFPWKSRSPYKFLSELITIPELISDKIVLIDGNTDRIDIARSELICET
jgi:hypothetical protein